MSEDKSEWDFDDLRTKKDVIEFLNKLTDPRDSVFFNVDADDENSYSIIEYWIRMSELIPLKEFERLIELRVINGKGGSRTPMWSRAWTHYMRNCNKIKAGTLEVIDYYNDIPTTDHNRERRNIQHAINRVQSGKFYYGHPK